VSEQETRSRLEHLREIVDGLERRMAVCESDQNYTIMARERRSTLAEIDSLGGTEQKPKETGLSDFEKRLRDRQAGSKTSRRTNSG
jgi:hypothetical protein